MFVILNTATAAYAETYQLVHAIGNEEKVIATALSKPDCEAKKRERIEIAEALGLHSERRGIGSITCLPESLFDDKQLSPR